MITFSRLGNHGRLGNQMFQYSLLKSISLKNNYTMAIPKQNHQLAECFSITSKVYDLENEKILNVLSKFHKVNEASFNYDESILNVSDNSDLSGNFQTEKYFLNNREIILKEFMFKQEIKSEALEIYKKLKNDNKELVSIHVRRGDYVNLEAYHPLCTLEYYKNCINNFKDVKFVCFSDDIKWCKLHFSFIDNVYYSESDNPYVDLCLMSMCDHNIIANSSYSWWGAWLNINLNKIVYAPKKWFGQNYSHHNIEDLLPKNWIKI